MSEKLRVNRPETAAKVLTELSKQARGVSRTAFLFMATFAIVASWEFGATVIAMSVCLAGIMSTFVYVLTLRILVLNWFDVQFFRPTPKKRMRSIPVTSRGRTTILDVPDRGGGD